MSRFDGMAIIKPSRKNFGSNMCGLINARAKAGLVYGYAEKLQFGCVCRCGDVKCRR